MKNPLVSLLALPFPNDHLEWIQKGKDKDFLVYIKDFQVSRRLDAVMGANNWRTEVIHLAPPDNRTYFSPKGSNNTAQNPPSYLGVGGMAVALDIRINGDWIRRTDTIEVDPKPSDHGFQGESPFRSAWTYGFRRVAMTGWNIGQFLEYGVSIREKGSHYFKYGEDPRSRRDFYVLANSLYNPDLTHDVSEVAANCLSAIRYLANQVWGYIPRNESSSEMAWHIYMNILNEMFTTGFDVASVLNERQAAINVFGAVTAALNGVSEQPAATLENQNVPLLEEPEDDPQDIVVPAAPKTLQSGDVYLFGIDDDMVMTQMFYENTIHEKGGIVLSTGDGKDAMTLIFPLSDLQDPPELKQMILKNKQKKIIGKYVVFVTLVEYYEGMDASDIFSWEFKLMKIQRMDDYLGGARDE